MSYNYDYGGKGYGYGQSGGGGGYPAYPQGGGGGGYPAYPQGGGGGGYPSYPQDDYHHDDNGYGGRRSGGGGDSGSDVFTRIASDISKLLPSIYNLKVVSAPSPDLLYSSACVREPYLLSRHAADPPFFSDRECTM